MLWPIFSACSPGHSERGNRTRRSSLPDRDVWCLSILPHPSIRDSNDNGVRVRIAPSRSSVQGGISRPVWGHALPAHAGDTLDLTYHIGQMVSNSGEHNAFKKPGLKVGSERIRACGGRWTKPARRLRYPPSSNRKVRLRRLDLRWNLTTVKHPGGMKQPNTLTAEVDVMCTKRI